MKAIIPLVVIAACAPLTNPAPGPLATSRATLAVGETTTIGGIGFRIIEVIEDSRCPPVVQCVWQGRVVVLVEQQMRGPLRHRIELGKPVAVPGGTLTLTDVEPPPLSGRRPDYRLTLTFTNAN